MKTGRDRARKKRRGGTYIVRRKASDTKAPSKRGEAPEKETLRKDLLRNNGASAPSSFLRGGHVKKKTQPARLKGGGLSGCQRERKRRKGTPPAPVLKKKKE